MTAKLTKWFKQETVFCIALALALASMILVPPSAAYWGYIDFSTLGLLFCLMAVVSGFRRLGLFDWLARRLLTRVGNFRLLGGVLVLLCFFSSMLITNDVALLTFAPLSITLLQITGKQRYLIGILVLQTVAANLGSMLTPVGNPQNLYLFQLSGMGLAGFIRLLLPYAALSLGLLLISCFWLPAETGVALPPEPFSLWTQQGWRARLLLHLSLFFLSLLAVVQLFPWWLLLAVVSAACLLWDRPVFKQVDISLLLTFVFFFIFIGNISAIPAVKTFLQSFVTGKEMAVAVLSSQLISNVPAAVLLSGFTQNYPSLLIGVDIGGLGTLIASMASLISYRFYTKTENCRVGRYLLIFTGVNVAFLLPNLLLYAYIGV